MYNGNLMVIIMEMLIVEVSPSNYAFTTDSGDRRGRCLIKVAVDNLTDEDVV